jgi:hypothetical protein
MFHIFDILNICLRDVKVLRGRCVKRGSIFYKSVHHGFVPFDIIKVWREIRCPMVQPVHHFSFGLTDREKELVGRVGALLESDLADVYSVVGH